MSCAKDEFDLLQSMRLSSLKDKYQLSATERNALADMQHRAVDEAQYVGHLLQDKVSRMRDEFSIRGRLPKPRSYTRDSSHLYGFFWFGQGKYEDDENDAAPHGSLGKQQQQFDTSTVSESSAAKSVSDEQRYCVWRPVEAPPPPRGASGAAPNARRPTRGLSSAVFARSPAVAPPRGRPALFPPWAEHYGVDAAPRPSQSPSQSQSQSQLQSQLQLQLQSPSYRAGVMGADRALLPRGANGIDGVLQRARKAQELLFALQDQRLRTDKENRKRATRAALDAQLEDKYRRALAQYEADAVQQFGPTMRHILSDAFGLLGPPRAIPWHSAGGGGGSHSDEKGSDGAGGEQSAAYVKEWERQRRGRAETEDEKAHRARRTWLAAWESHKQQQQQQQQEQQQRQRQQCERGEDKRLEHRAAVLCSADRLLAAEQQRRADYLRFRAAIGDQSGQNTSTRS